MNEQEDTLNPNSEMGKNSSPASEEGNNSAQKDQQQPTESVNENAESSTNADKVKVQSTSEENKVIEPAEEDAAVVSEEVTEEVKAKNVELKSPVAAATKKAAPKSMVKKPLGEKKWYVVRAISGKENKVKLYLDQEINRLGLTDYVSQVLIPKEKIYTIKAGKKVSKERSYFPGYILVEANLVGEIPHIIESTTGVIGFLASKGQPPAPIRVSEVNRILGKVDELAESEEMINVPYVVGETVKVTDGPFNSFSGIIEEVNEEKKKLKVMVKIFGRKTPLELGYLQVEKE